MPKIDKLYAAHASARAKFINLYVQAMTEEDEYDCESDGDLWCMVDYAEAELLKARQAVDAREARDLKKLRKKLGIVVK